MFYEDNRFTPMPQADLLNIYHQYQINDNKPTGKLKALAEHLDLNWLVVFDPRAKAMLASLTTHKKEEIIKGKYVDPTKYNHDKKASYEFNNFISNIRSYGFDRAAEQVNQHNLNRVRNSKGHEGHVFHNHFGTQPEYIFEYEVHREERVVVVKKIFAHGLNDFLKKTGTLDDVKDELIEARVQVLGRAAEKITRTALLQDLNFNLHPELLVEQNEAIRMRNL